MVRVYAVMIGISFLKSNVVAEEDRKGSLHQSNQPSNTVTCEITYAHRAHNMRLSPLTSKGKSALRQVEENAQDIIDVRTPDSIGICSISAVGQVKAKRVAIRRPCAESSDHGSISCIWVTERYRLLYLAQEAALGQPGKIFCHNVIMPY